MPLQKGFEPLWGTFRCLPTAQVTDPFLRSYRSERLVPKDLFSSTQLLSTYLLVAVTSSRNLKAKQKLDVTFNSNKRH